MKNRKSITAVSFTETAGHTNDPDIIISDPHIRLLEKERHVLLALGDDLTKVREKNDLILLFSSRIRELYPFSHSLITLINYASQTYTPFLLDPAPSPVESHHAYPALITAHYPVDSPLIQQVLTNDAPTAFIIRDIMDVPGNPDFLRLNYEAGIREILLTPLKSKEQPIGFLHMYAADTTSFTDEFRNVIKGIAPQISSAVTNIIKNEEIAHEEWINEVLLSLSNEMAKVRTRQDLLKVITSSLRELICFSHSMMTVMDETLEYYKAYLVDEEARLSELTDCSEALSIPVDDGIYDIASLYYKPLIFDMQTLNMDTMPAWCKLQYEAGAREMIVKILGGNGSARYGLMLFAPKTGTFGPTAANIIQRISSQLFTAASNISANEEILRRENEKSFLLEFSHDIAAVRTKDELKQAIFRVLQQVLNVKLPMIRILEDDGLTLSPYMYDETMFEKMKTTFTSLSAKNIDIHEALSARVLNSEEPVIFNIAEEVRQGNPSPYIPLWQSTGMANTFGARLRVGNTNLGTIWLLTDDINLNILKGICAQISIAISNIRANEKILAYKQKLEIENDYLKEQIQTIYNFSEIIGSGAQMQKTYRLISQVAESSSTVLLLGETGTGKELIARAIHNASPRKGKLMVKVNCAALPAHLIESELFGHEKGAFTGAIDRRIGKFELANHSTLFLDEIGEMPPELQVKLLRVLQERELERIGGRTTIKVDVRIIAATNRNLEAEVQAGRFRSDLYYRLNVFPINLPPLRERQEDIAPLANFFVAKFSKNTGKKVNGLSAKVLQELKSYHWPGNVRELEHLIERSILLCDGHMLKEIHLPRHQPGESAQSPVFSNATLEQIERAYIVDVLKRCSGKISGAGGAAEILEIPGTTLHSKIKKLGISKADYFMK
ncbi:AAA domain-containing protein [Chitinophaga agrisoli]|uniref:AAA domain-containing protein n=1 Tax=Chitinophaga agrisoli TaxID=2607653 RepID=A0A5B2VJ30_9BACT|nr:sigma 54-interacting transcriptional regulator [Chitinophaga agrisoli]KAA2239593.1 AAA domain-containing protein [Chitinophaga agrisoli]